MSSGCSGDCSNCASSSNCESKKQDMRIPAGPYSDIKKVIGIVSGKGGVGKSLVTSLLACAMQTRGNQCAILDADLSGPSIPKSFGIHTRAQVDATGILPEITRTGIKLMSANFLLEDEESPVIWRGPIISNYVQQFWKDVAWGDIDYMFVDMPPGTSDVPLTVFQSLPLNGIIVVTAPTDLVTLIVKKSTNMAKLMDIPILGIIENMSYTICPDCNKKIEIFGESKADAVAKELGVPVLAKIPLDCATAALVDKGAVELADDSYLDEATKVLEGLSEND